MGKSLVLALDNIENKLRGHFQSQMEGKPYDDLLEQQRIDGLKLFVEWYTAYNCICMCRYFFNPNG